MAYILRYEGPIDAVEAGAPMFTFPRGENVTVPEDSALLSLLDGDFATDDSFTARAYVDFAVARGEAKIKVFAEQAEAERIPLDAYLARRAALAGMEFAEWATVKGIDLALAARPSADPEPGPTPEEDL